VKFKYSNTRQVRAATLSECDFTPATKLVDHVVSGGSTSDAIVADRNIRTTTGATIAHEAFLAGIDVVDGSLLTRGFSWSNLTPAVATFDDATGRLTRVADGTASVVLRTPWLNRRADVAVSQTASSTSETLNFVTGALGRAMCDAVDSRIAGKTPSVAKPIYSTRDDANANYTRNTSCWLADLDLACMSVWNSYAGNLRAGALISPRHVMMVKHWQIGIGSVLRFVTNSNVTVSRTLSNVVEIAGADLAVGVLDSDVPGTIGFAKVLPSNITSYITQSGNGACVVNTDQEKKAIVAEIGNWNSQWFNQFPTNTTRLAFNESIVSGDSGAPMFVIVNGVLVLVSTMSGPGAGIGDAVHQHLTAINAAMTTLGGGYQLTQVSLAGFPTYP
jgi:hypothetical protein